MKLMHSCASKFSKIICLLLLGYVMISMNETELKHLNVTLVIFFFFCNVNVTLVIDLELN